MKKILALASVAALSGCALMDSGSSYKQGVDANVQVYKYFSDSQLAQQAGVQACFSAAKTDAQLGMCSTLAAGVNATQTLAGRPAEIRVAKSPAEIIESIVNKGLDATIMVYGIKAVQNVVASATAVQAKDPMVIRPEVIQTPAPEVILVPTAP